VLLAGAGDTTAVYGIRKAQLDAFIALASTPAAVARLDAWLDSASVSGGIPLRPPTRWAIVTRPVSLAHPASASRLAAEERRDSTAEGRRRAFAAGAARPDAETKRAYFERYFSDRQLNEDWATASLRAFNDPAQSALTRGYLIPALDSLSWIQQHRRIFFLGSWLGAFLGGQRDEHALAAVDAYLAAHAKLPRDLRLKILQARDELERTVRIRRRFAA
jgi:aminopeptidase N